MPMAKAGKTRNTPASASSTSRLAVTAADASAQALLLSNWGGGESGLAGVVMPP